MRDPSTWLLMWDSNLLAEQSCGPGLVGTAVPAMCPISRADWCWEVPTSVGINSKRIGVLFGCVARKYARQLRRHGVFTMHCSCRIWCCDLHHFAQE
jgi:hypothetical protein